MREHHDAGAVAECALVEIEAGSHRIGIQIDRDHDKPVRFGDALHVGNRDCRHYHLRPRREIERGEGQVPRGPHGQGHQRVGADVLFGRFYLVPGVGCRIGSGRAQDQVTCRDIEIMPRVE